MTDRDIYDPATADKTLARLEQHVCAIEDGLVAAADREQVHRVWTGARSLLNALSLHYLNTYSPICLACWDLAKRLHKARIDKWEALA